MSTATQSKERPILFSGPMVRAILEGRKTQTRRIVKGKGTWAVVYNPDSERTWPGAEDECGDWQDFECPYGNVGDRLWVRETCCCDGWSVHYTADNGHVEFGDTRYDDALKLHHYSGGFSRQVPSIHMPRWASRITLEITGVRVERLNDISESDAKAEGVSANESWSIPWWQGYKQWGEQLVHQVVQGVNPPEWMIEPKPSMPTDHLSTTAADEFKRLWGSINGSASWDANPWVWVVEFKRNEQR